MTKRQQQYLTEAIGPQVVGGRYYCGYWRNEYVVDRIWTTRDNPLGWSDWAIEVHDVTEINTGNPTVGSPRIHCTAWEPKQDRVLSI